MRDVYKHGYRIIINCGADQTPSHNIQQSEKVTIVKWVQFS